MPLFDTTAYASADDAQSYFDGRLNADAWDGAGDADRCKALLMATRAIDRLNFAGLRTADHDARLTTLSETGLLTQAATLAPPALPGQPLEFPRDGAAAIPKEIVIACCECALAFLDGVDPELEMQGLSVSSNGFAAVRESYDPRVVRLAYRHGIPSMVAWTYLQPFLADPSEFSFRRVN